MTYLFILILIGLIAALGLTLKKLQKQRLKTFMAEHKLTQANKKIKDIEQKYNALATRDQSFKQSKQQIKLLQDQLKHSRQQIESLESRTFPKVLEAGKTRTDFGNTNGSGETSKGLAHEVDQEAETQRQEAKYLKQQAEQEVERLRQQANQEAEISKQEIQQLRQKVEQELEALRQESEKDVEALRQEAKNLKREADKLRHKVKSESKRLSQKTYKPYKGIEKSSDQSFRIEVQKKERAELFLDYAERIEFKAMEKDFYPQERKEVIIDILKCCRESVRQNSRRQHIIDDVIFNNITSASGKAIKMEVQNLFRDYTRLNSRTRKTLEDMGFEIVSEKNHYKIIFNGDSRYTISFAKTPSDRRTGRNIASDICNLLL